MTLVNEREGNQFEYRKTNSDYETKEVRTHKDSLHQKHRITAAQGWRMLSITGFLSYMPERFGRNGVEIITVEPYQKCY